MLIGSSGFAQYTKLFDFSGTNGKYPNGALTSDGTFLYGMTNAGGASNNDGVIYKIKQDGTGFVKLFDSLSATLGGGNLSHSLISDSTFLYGMGSLGGSSGNCLGGCGTIFKIKPDGTGYSKVLDFDGINGYAPVGGLISDGTFLYGMAYGGGAGGACSSQLGCGTVFKIKPDGTGFVKLLDFAGTNGKQPNGNLFSDSTFLYGMTEQGGINDSGTVFKIKPDGTNYSKLTDFSGGTNGKHPRGTFISDGTFLYGVSAGGTNSYGVIFKVKPDGTNFTTLWNFTDSLNGKGPSPLVFDGTFLYGTTIAGGTTDNGTIFKIKTDGTGFVKLLDFNYWNGSFPMSPLIIEGSFLYGTTYDGGIHGDGVIYKYALPSAGIVETNNDSEITVYPNPGNGIFTIIANNVKKSQIEVFNIIGEKVYYSPINSEKSECDLSTQTKGIYFMKVISENKTISYKKIVIR